MENKEIELDEEEKSNTINEQDSNNEESPLERFYLDLFNERKEQAEEEFKNRQKDLEKEIDIGIEDLNSAKENEEYEGHLQDAIENLQISKNNLLLLNNAWLKWNNKINNQSQLKKESYASRLRKKFNEKTNQYIGKKIKNFATGIEAVFSKESQKEIRSQIQNSKKNGFTLAEHFEAANQIIELFELSTLENEHRDVKHNQANTRMERFLSPKVELNSGKKIQVCITVKHSITTNGRNIYAIEAMDIKNALELTRAKGQAVTKVPTLSNNSIIAENDELSIEQLPNVKKVQEEHEKTSSNSSSVNRQKTADDEQTNEQVKTVLDFSMIVSGKFKSFSNMKLKEQNDAGDYCVLSNGEDSVTVPIKTYNELLNPPKIERPEANYVNLIKNQYDYYFEPRDNTANNFRHNLSVFCRKEANSPVDALNVAKGIISRMNSDEQKKIKLILKQMENEERTVNDIIAGMYHDAVKEFPLNEDVIQSRYPADARKRLTSDVISDKGHAISDDQSLKKSGIDKNPKIGQTFENLVMNLDSVVGKGSRPMKFESLTIVSSSETSNKVTLKDKNNSFIEVDREKFIDSYKQTLARENKQEKKKNRNNEMAISY